MSAPAPALTRTILVVEDEASIAEAVATRLRSEGFEVSIAADGPAGVERCRDLQPDLVVLDLMLPGLDGLDVCRAIQRERPVPVLMLTARDSETDLVVGLEVGADDYLTKPFSSRELVARVHALLRRVERRPGSAARRGPARPGHHRPGVAPRPARRRARAPHADRVRPPRVPRRTTHAGVHPRAAPRRGVGLPRRRRRVAPSTPHVRALRRKLGNEVVRTVHGVGYAAGDRAADGDAT